MATASVSQSIEQKNKFQISNEVKGDFVNEIAQSMLKLSKDKQENRTIADAQLDPPYFATTGFSFTGVNMARLMLSSMEKEHQDNRWVSYKQLQSLKDKHPELEMKIRQGEKGIKILGSQEIKFIIKDSEEWEFPTDERIKELHNLQKQGVETPKISKSVLFYPFTVFNAEQIDGFPPKESPALEDGQSLNARNDLTETFVSSSGIKVEHHFARDNDTAYYYPDEDVIKMPFSSDFENKDAYTATKLRLVFAATGHGKRENRDLKSNTYEGVATETMRGDMFSMLAAARYGLPMPQNNSIQQIDHWNQTFAGGDTKALFLAISDAAKIITSMDQYAQGEQPRTRWFPKMEERGQLEREQKARDIKAQGTRPDDIANRQSEKVLVDAQKEKEIKIRQDKIAIEAQQRWAGLPEVQRKHGCLIEKEVEENHPYLVDKGIKAFGLKQVSYRYSPNDVYLMVPMQNIKDEIRGLQFIDEDGEMGFLESQAFHNDTMDKTGIFHLINPENRQINLVQSEILICEDYATGASLHMATNKPVVVAFDVYNFEAVAKQIREKYPDSNITICATNDLIDGPESYKTGKAQYVASEVNCKVIIPNLSENDKKLGLSTFNDIHKTYGLEALQKQMVAPSQSTIQNSSNSMPKNSMSRAEMDKAQAKDMQEIEQANKIREVLNNPELLNQALAQLKNNPDADNSFNPALAETAVQNLQRSRRPRI